MAIIHVHRRIAPVNDHAGVIAVDNTDMAVPALFVGHRLGAAVTATAVTSTLEELIGVPAAANRVGNPAGNITAAAPKGEAMGEFVELYHYIDMVSDSPELVPFGTVL